MSPEVTAVITTHARPALVREALRSVQADAYQDMEIVVVDDGGTFAAPTAARLPIRAVHGSNLGVARARNLGLAAARGEFVIYLDDDDIALPNRVSSLLRAAKQRQATMTFGMTRRIIDGGSQSLVSVPTHLAFGRMAFRDILTCAPHVNAVLVRTDVLRSVGGFDEGAEHFDDWSAWLRIADREDAVICSVADTVAEWRIHSNGLSGRVLDTHAMKHRILGLMEHLQRSLSDRNAPAIADARRMVASEDIVTYDDYVDLMARTSLVTM